MKRKAKASKRTAPAPKVRARKPLGRPRISDAEKRRRGTFQPVHARDHPALPPVLDPVPAVPDRDYVGVARQYVRDVLAGRVLACEWVRRACARQEADRGASDPAWPYIWSDAEATAVCAFLERLPHVEGAWSTATIHLEPWQVFLVTTLFGWRKRDNPRFRRFTVLYFELGRKGAKSTLMAGLALYHVLCEGEPGASVVCGATTGAQARIVFSVAQRMVKRSQYLRALGVEALANAIVTQDGSIKPVNSRASTLDGLNPSCIVLDESHAQSFELHDVLKSAQGARPNPLLLCPTTAGHDMLSVGYALRTTLTKVLAGFLTADHFFGSIYTLDDGDDWRDERVWVKANPMLGITPTLANLRTYCLDAQQTPSLEGEFRVKYCSQWFQSAHMWLSMTDWDACADPTLRIEAFTGLPCWIGVDLAQSDDFAAVVYVFQRDDVLVAFARFYLPRDVVAARMRTVPAYGEWIRAGLLDLTDGNMTDFRRIDRDIRAACQLFTVQAIRFDQFASKHITAELIADGFPAAILDKNRKSITPPALDLEARVKARRFRHDGNACLRWNAANACVTRGIDDSILPKKDREDSPNKVDGIDALLQAMAAMLVPAGAAPEYRIFVG